MAQINRGNLFMCTLANSQCKASFQTESRNIQYMLKVSLLFRGQMVPMNTTVLSNRVQLRLKFRDRETLPLQQSTTCKLDPAWHLVERDRICQRVGESQNNSHFCPPSILSNHTTPLVVTLLSIFHSRCRAACHMSPLCIPQDLLGGGLGSVVVGSFLWQIKFSVTTSVGKRHPNRPN